LIALVATALVGVPGALELTTPNAGCATPPDAGAGRAEPVEWEHLTALLPASLPGLSVEFPQAITPESRRQPQELRDAGFLYGVVQVYERQDAHVDVSVFQFRTARGARAFEASEMAMLCDEGYRRVGTPTPLDGASIRRTHSFRSATTRTSFIRGSRAFVVYFSGDEIPRSFRRDVNLGVAELAR
jgi:hypothetical protein